MNTQFHVGADSVLEWIAGTCAALDHSRLHKSYKSLNGPRQGVLFVDVFYCGFDRAAAAMPQNQNQRHVQLRDGVFDAAFYRSARPADDVAGHPDDKDIADAHVE